jgi:multidrug efflux pump subunit AcrA (membrane-fusion protein)
VTAQDQARLNFQTPGKLVYLPFKEGDNVYQGQTIAQLDTYQLQRQLTAALNTYRATRDTFDQTQANVADSVTKAQQTYPYDYYTRAGLTGSADDTAISDAIKRIADQSQASLDNSVINVELVNYALQLSTLTSPLHGIILHEDVTVPGINITPATTFIVADPDTMVFRANVPTENIYYISEGSTVTLAIDGIQNKLSGTVVKIYPSKVILPGGQAVYQVDIASDDLKKQAKLDETGRAMISTNSEHVALVPAWTVLGGKYIWIDNNGTPELRQVTAGKIHGSEIEITGGLSPDDQIIIDPKFIPSLKYQLL